MEFLGVRVVRGPDWKWGNQDGGEGSVGTVVHSTTSLITEPVLCVQWDSGGKAMYRAGVDGKYDLRILDSANGGEKHLCTSCDGCQQKPIIGSRWHCKTCLHYDLCTLCYMTDCHHKGHTFERIDKSHSKGVEVGKRWGSTKLQARGLFRGAKVIHGSDREVNDQDGNSNVDGVVKEVVSSTDEDSKDSVRVSWKKGGQTNIRRVDVKCTVPAIGGSYYRDHLAPLVLKQKRLQSRFATGDKVVVELTRKQFEELFSGQGQCNADKYKFANQVLDISLKETSSTNLNTAGVAMSGAENADLTNEENSGLSKKPNETSLMIGPREHYSEMVALCLGYEKNTAGQTEDKREKFTCRICEENEAVVILKPCGHIVLCTECAPLLKPGLECQRQIIGKATGNEIPVISVNTESLATKYQILKEKIRKLEESIQCCVCTERKKNVVFLCGHGACQDCADQLETCQICRKKTTKKIQMF